jgi:hypothetical protein
MTIGIFTGISIVIGIGTGRDVLEGGPTLQHIRKKMVKKIINKFLIIK